MLKALALLVKWHKSQQFFFCVVLSLLCLLNNGNSPHYWALTGYPALCQLLYVNSLTEPFPSALLFPEYTFSPARDLSLLWEKILKTFHKEGSYTTQETTCGYQFSQDGAGEKTQSSDQQSSMSSYWGPLPVRVLLFSQKALILKERAEKKYIYISFYSMKVRI